MLSLVIFMSLFFYLLVMIWADYFNAEAWTGTETIIETITNIAFATGVFVLGTGMIIVIGNSGLFDILVYGTKKFFFTVINAKQKLKAMDPTYYDYTSKKRERDRAPAFPIIVVGLIHVLIAIALNLYLYSIR